MTGQGWAIRPATADEAPLVAALGARLFIDAYGPTHPEPERSVYVAGAFAVDRFTGCLTDPAAAVFLALGDDDTPIGYAQLRMCGPDPAPGVIVARSAEIARFYVDAAYHGHGVAPALMRTCCDWATGRRAEWIWLQAWTEAPRALAFYRREGFRVVGRTTFQFGTRVDDDVVLARPLAAAPVAVP